MNLTPARDSRILEPTTSQVDECYQIVQSLSSSRSDAKTKGFMHGHQPREDWDRYQVPGRFFVSVSNGKVDGFVIVVPLGGPDTEHFFGARGVTEWSKEGVLEIPNLLFVEKVAIAPHAHGQGIGRKLYTHIFNQNPQATFFTALVEKPLHNQASEDFHTKMGFKRVGTFKDGSFGSLNEYQSGIFLRS